MSKAILEIICALFDETFLIVDDVGVVYGGEDANFIECVFFLSIIEVVKLHFFYRVYLVVDQSLCLVNTRVCAFTCVYQKIPSFPKNWKSFSDI